MGCQQTHTADTGRVGGSKRARLASQAADDAVWRAQTEAIVSNSLYQAA